MDGKFMSALSFIAILGFALSPSLGLAQANPDFLGKWVVDTETMASIDPDWDRVLTAEMWISTRFRDGQFRVVRSTEDFDSYDPSGSPTTIVFDETEAVALTSWEGERLVAEITLVNTGASFLRVIYREDRFLIIEDQGRDGDYWQRTYFVKS